jgi:hypothetical protein
MEAEESRRRSRQCLAQAQLFASSTVRAQVINLAANGWFSPSEPSGGEQLGQLQLLGD